MPTNHSKLFQLKPVRAALVSEISETTSAAPVTDKERVNFHIGNPLYDDRQVSAYLRTLLGLDDHEDLLHKQSSEQILDILGWQPADKPKLDFLIQTVTKSSPYMPRGGYHRKKPPLLIQLFHSWLNQQQEPLIYDFGEQSGKREVIITSGGNLEAIRILLFVLSTHLEHTPARILTFNCQIPPFLSISPTWFSRILGQISTPPAIKSVNSSAVRQIFLPFYS